MLSPSPNSTKRRRRKRGRRGGLQFTLRRRGTRPPPPLRSIYSGNVRSFRKIMDEFESLFFTRRDFKDCYIFCFTETWHDPLIPDSAVPPPGFHLYRCDRVCQAVKKSHGGGVYFLVNGRWCTDCRVLSDTCTPGLESLTIHCRPYYMPKELSSIVFTVAYISPDANANSAMCQLSEMINNQKITPRNGRR